MEEKTLIKWSMKEKEGYKVMKTGNNVFTDMKVTHKLDTFGNDEYVLYNDKEVVFMNVGNPNKFGKENRLYTQMASRYPKIKDYIFDITITVSEQSIGGEHIKIANISRIVAKGKNDLSDTDTEYEGFD
jgi:hypothetical protein